MKKGKAQKRKGQDLFFSCEEFIKSGEFRKVVTELIFPCMN
jgi:hypothetical protein